MAELEKAGIRFEIETSVSQIRSQSPYQAGYGGTFGSGAQVLISVWTEDWDQFRQIHRRLFGS